MKTKTFARTVKVMMALSLATQTPLVRAATAPVDRPKLSGLQKREINRAVDLLLAGLPKANADKIRTALATQLKSRAVGAPSLERLHPVVRDILWFSEGMEADLLSEADALAKKLVANLRNLGDPARGREAFKNIGDFALLNGANAGDQTTRWLIYAAKVGGALGLLVAGGLMMRFFGRVLHDPTSSQDGTYVLILSVVLAAGVGGFTVWETTRPWVLQFLAGKGSVQRRVARQTFEHFWLRVADSLQGLPEYRKLTHEKDPAKIALEVRNVIVNQYPTIFDDCSGLLE